MIHYIMTWIRANIGLSVKELKDAFDRLAGKV